MRIAAILSSTFHAPSAMTPPRPTDRPHAASAPAGTASASEWPASTRPPDLDASAFGSTLFASTIFDSPLSRARVTPQFTALFDV